MPEQYFFFTNWQLKSHVEEVWNAVYNSLEWPEWWNGVKSVTEIRSNDPTGVNGIRRYTWKSIMPYSLTFDLQLTEIELYKRLKGNATGDLVGTGEWFFIENDGITDIRYQWNIYTSINWMNRMAFLLKPFFTYSHNVVMHWGGVGLAKKLNTRLLKG